MAFVYDANGNVGQLVDEAGSAVGRYEYDAFGNVLVASGAEAEGNLWRFSTKQFDAETALVYYGYRLYSAGLGRWLNRDPIGERGGTNLYRFVSNGPTVRLDRDGLEETGISRAVLDVIYDFAADYVGTGFSRYLLARYMYGNGEPLELVPGAFVEHIAPRASVWDPNLHTREGKLPQDLRSDLAEHCGCSGNSNGNFNGRYRFGAYSDGGIGNFVMEAQVSVRCAQNVAGGIDWELYGDAAMLIPDVYDFNWDAGGLLTRMKSNYEQGEPDIQYREPRTAAGSFVPGTPFTIHLDGIVGVRQTSRMPEAKFHE
jgi:RHS repeat-associated protein